jgi:hypothetical protein
MKSKVIAESQIKLCEEREQQILLILSAPGDARHTAELEQELGHIRALAAEDPSPGADLTC